MRIYLDGACSGNGQVNAEAGYGFVVCVDSETIYTDNGKVPGKQTNNRAELTALLKALKYVQKKRPDVVEFLSDSQILVDGVLGKAKRRASRDIWTQIEALFAELRGDVAISIRHIPREKNVLADAQAKAAAQSLI